MYCQVDSRPGQINTHAKQTALLCNWLRFRPHVLSNLWRLCLMVKSVEIMQQDDIMPPFSLIAFFVLFPPARERPTHFIPGFLPLMVHLVLFSLYSQFPSVVVHPRPFQLCYHFLLFTPLPPHPIFPSTSSPQGLWLSPHK